MNTDFYLDKMQKSIDLLDKAAFSKRQLEFKIGVWLNSVVLKIQEKAWLNQTSVNAFGESVFFSIWINDDTMREGKIYYNIHALKLRELTGYKIKSRHFAESFRDQFKPYAKDWPNVSVAFGPLTLMEGWVKLDMNKMEDVIANLATRFFVIQPIINALLLARKK